MDKSAIAKFLSECKDLHNFIDTTNEKVRICHAYHLDEYKNSRYLVEREKIFSESASKDCMNINIIRLNRCNR